MKRMAAAHQDSWKQYVTLFTIFDKAGVPEDSRWRSLLLYFRNIKNYNHISDPQKIDIQALLTSTLERRDFSEERFKAILKEYYTIITRPCQMKLDALLREAAEGISSFQRILSARYGDISALEEESVTIVSDDGEDPSVSVIKLRDAFGRVKALVEDDIRGLEHMATRDGMTNLSNRRAFDLFMDKAVALWLSKSRPLSMALFDVDHFKKFNDEHGHRIGDQVLIVVAKYLQKALAGIDDKNQVIAARYGGEEFALVISGPDASLLASATEKCRNSIKKFNFLIRDSYGNVVESGLHITVSAGVVSAWEGWQGAHLTNLIDSADKALYFAKQSGRDRAIEFKPNEESPFSLITLEE